MRSLTEIQLINERSRMIDPFDEESLRDAIHSDKINDTWKFLCGFLGGPISVLDTRLNPGLTEIEMRLRRISDRIFDEYDGCNPTSLQKDGYRLFSRDGNLITEEWLISLGVQKQKFSGPSCGRLYEHNGIEIDGYQTFAYDSPSGMYGDHNEIIVCWIGDSQMLTKRDELLKAISN